MESPEGCWSTWNTTSRSSRYGPARWAHPPGFCCIIEDLGMATICKPPEKAQLTLPLGAVFTRPKVVEFILDLVGYATPWGGVGLPLHQKRILEPSFGDGAFLLPIIRRLLSAWRAAGQPQPATDHLAEAIRAVELHHATFAATRARVVALLQQEGLERQAASTLASHWLIPGDYLTASLQEGFDFVVGNPPYVRWEEIPHCLRAEYKSRYATVRGRADLYVPFIERSLALLKEGGRLGFICADRWTKNRYGAALRKLVAEHFHLKIYVDMTGVQAFQAKAAAYPAITIISRERPGPTRVGLLSSLAKSHLSQLVSLLQRDPLPAHPQVQEVKVAGGEAPWVWMPSEAMAILRRLEQGFPNLEAAGCQVGIGVATGADKAFIGEFATLDVEPDRKLPLLTTQDILLGEVRWRGKGVVNPFHEDGRLVDLQDYPRLSAYLEARRDLLANRYCARRAPTQWYRTIDRIIPSLAQKPKLLIPDIKGRAQVVFEPGGFYPHHNLYFVTSASWDLRALQAVLLSAVSHLFVAAYSTRMRGGYLRFQAQYLRRIRIPYWADVPQNLRLALAKAAEEGSLEACNRAVFALYGLSEDEKAVLEGLQHNA